MTILFNKAKRSKTEKNKGLTQAWIFTACIFSVFIFISWLQQVAGVRIWIWFAPFAVGVLAFVFQTFLQHRPLIEIYSKNHPYRKLKPHGVITAFLLFEFVLVWGLFSKQIVTQAEDLFLITLVFIGAIAYYHTFVRMKISLRFLFLAIFIPVIAAGATLGLGSYFKILKFVAPATPVDNTVFLNTIYWILFYIFLQTICEEPAFRGYLMQRLLDKGESFAILVSSLIFAVWRSCFGLFSGMELEVALIMFIGNFISGAIFALLFIKGRNLLVAVLCHGIIEGLRSSMFAPSATPGIIEYVRFLVPRGGTQLMVLWLVCLFIGLILLTVTPRKKFYVH